MKNKEWSEIINYHRCKKGISRCRLAEMVDVDPSYITLIERNGQVPRRDKVVALARALDGDLDEMLLKAGYAPENISTEAVLELAGRKDDQRQLVPALHETMRELAALPEEQQQRVAEVINAYVCAQNRNVNANHALSALRYPAPSYLPPQKGASAPSDGMGDHSEFRAFG